MSFGSDINIIQKEKIIHYYVKRSNVLKTTGMYYYWIWTTISATGFANFWLPKFVFGPACRILQNQLRPSRVHGVKKSDETRFSKKMWGPKLGPKGAKMGPKLVLFFAVIEKKSLEFASIAYGNRAMVSSIC